MLTLEIVVLKLLSVVQCSPAKHLDVRTLSLVIS